MLEFKIIRRGIYRTSGSLIDVGIARNDNPTYCSLAPKFTWIPEVALNGRIER
jgi:hypothetical protein